MATIRAVDGDEGVGIRHVPPHRAKLLAAPDQVDLEPDLDMAELLHTFTSTMNSAFATVKDRGVIVISRAMQQFPSAGRESELATALGLAMRQASVWSSTSNMSSKVVINRTFFSTRI